MERAEKVYPILRRVCGSRIEAEDQQKQRINQESTNLLKSKHNL